MHEIFPHSPNNEAAQLSPPVTHSEHFSDVDQTALTQAYPGLVTGAEAFATLVEANENARVKGAVSRRSRRQFEHNNVIGGAGRRFIFMGAHIMAQGETIEAGRQAGEAVISELPSDLSRLPDPNDNEDKGGSFRYLWDTRAMSIVEPIQRIHEASRLVASEIEATDPDDLDRNYLLLKALATDPDTKHFEPKINVNTGWRLSHALVALSGIARSNIGRRLSTQAQEGAFDTHIAGDIVRFADNERAASADFAKIRQLGRFGLAFAGDSPEDRAVFYSRMAAAYGEWPAVERRIVTDGRQAILDAAGTNVTRAESWLREFGFVTDDNPLAVFAESIDALILESIKRDSFSGPGRAGMLALMQQRGLHKRIRATSRDRRDKRKEKTGALDEAAEGEAENRTPPTMKTINLNDNTASEGVQGLIDTFIAEASQSDPVKIRADLERMVAYMMRTDLPPGERRGVKTITNVQVTFAPDGQPRRLLEFKPSDAPGLPTATNLAKNSRIYFIELPGDIFDSPGKVLGIIGIEPRAKQDAVLRELRARSKRSPGGKRQDETDEM